MTATPVAGANLAYQSFISFPESVYSLIYSATHPAIHTATYSATQIDFDFFHYIL